MIFYDDRRTCPYFNLAAEEFLLNSAPPDETIFRLWRNAPAVIVGRHQNALSEVCVPYIDSHGIALVRRLTGGGAVYHDLGNLNYTFITADSGGPLDFAPMVEPVLRLLGELRLPARLDGRNDVTLDGKKFSGCAQSRSNGRLLHHGTLLFSADFDAMAVALSPDPEKFRSHAVASVRSRVTNLAEYLPPEITLSVFADRLVETVARSTSERFERRRFSDEQIRAVEKLRDEKYRTWDWNVGRSPRCDFVSQKRFVWGNLSVELRLDEGRIASAAFRGDFFALADPTELAALFVGRRFCADEIKNALSESAVRSVFPNLSRGELLELLGLAPANDET